MKYAYREMPEGMKGTFGEFSRNFGFCWKEFVITVPSPMFLVTTYKSNGQPNACMQSWATFTSADHGNGFYAILTNVNKNGHLYRSLQFLEGGSCYYHCSAGTDLLTLLADGTLLPCRRLPIPVGNCLETDMLTLYQSSPLIRELRAQRIPDECLSCVKAELCRGGAKCLTYALTGDYNHKDPNCYYPAPAIPQQPEPDTQ